MRIFIRKIFFIGLFFTCPGLTFVFAQTKLKIIFHSEIYNDQDQLLNIGDVTLYFMRLDGMKRCEMPLALKEKLEKYF